MRIALAVPCHSMIHADTHSAICGLHAISLRHGRDLVLATTSASIVGNARNAAVDFARSCQATHLLMIDSDMIFPPWLLEEYLRHDVDIIGTPYRRRGPPWGMMGEMEPDQDLAALAEGEAPVKFKWLATGLMMVKMSVFDKLTKPYFKHPVENGKLKGEDLQFCEDVKAVGYDINGLLHFPRIGHIIEGVLWNDELNIMPAYMYDQKKAKEASDGSGSRQSD